ncbi:OLC1v1035876C1 [Oldenlandia corymbosa var. corymbosa]|uniref:OLC1v1035876C1 n=1 Tax=Oldenlandia corymbosa var. corymbosa TaxID=529605 RepID=A0AAV1CVU9_OLDCO|nr:OLC1v1035876C1 [Oldenlandia corymbosa var. corymbosa]
MSNPPQLAPQGPGGGASAASSSTSAATNQAPAVAVMEMKPHSVEDLVHQLTNPSLREEALLRLSKIKEGVPELGPLIWNSPGIIAVLLQEIISVYPHLSSPDLIPAMSNWVANVFTLLQRVATHPDTKIPFLKANIPFYLYPFINTTNKSKSFGFIRVTSLCVMGELVKGSDPDVIRLLLETEILQICLHSIEIGGKLSKKIATFILHRILQEEFGLEYVCSTEERLISITRVLGEMVTTKLCEESSHYILKLIVQCYIRLSDHPKACESLRQCLPSCFRDASFSRFLGEDLETSKCLQQLLHNVLGVAFQAGNE